MPTPPTREAVLAARTAVLTARAAYQAGALTLDEQGDPVVRSAFRQRRP
jgi:hypothetical protein